MHVTRRGFGRLLGGAASGCLIGAAPVAAQQGYPTKPIQLIIPYPPGGSDLFGRKLAQGMSEALGQTIVVVNKPGASTQIATNYVVNSQPDGYTLYFAPPSELSAGPSMFKSLPFNHLTDLTPITFAGSAPYTLMASPTIPVKTYAELIAYMKANPDKLRFGSYGVQTQPDILARRLNLALGTDFQIIPYQGGSPALNAMTRGEVNLLFVTLIPTRSLIQSGQLVPLAIAADKRVPLFPDLPTLKELGVDLVDGASFGLMGPKGLPPEVVDKMHKTLVAELNKPDVKKFVEDMGVVPAGTTPAEFTAQLKQMTDYWVEFAPKLGIEKQ